MRQTIGITVNDKDLELEVDANRLLAEVLRDDLGLTGTKRACESNICGACTVLLNGMSVHSCTVLAIQADGATVTTIEGLSQAGELHPVQQAFLDHLGYQCGFCTPGMIMSSVALLNEVPHPTEEQVKHGLTGNICRCTGYIKIIESVLAAAESDRA